MKVEAIHAEGYGELSDFRLPPDEASWLSPSLTVVLGPNEAGKTTLLSFIRAILFGFPDARSRENRYPPLRGGRHGGRIFLLDSAGNRYIVERFAGPRGGPVLVTLPDGSRGAGEVLPLLLGGASRDLFQSIFAFSLAELQDFETLASDSVAARIYSVGLGAGRLPLPEIDRRVDQERAKLFKEGGSAQHIAKLIQEAESVHRRLRELAGQTADYDHLCGRQETLSRQIEATLAELRKEQGHLERRRNLTRAWTDWTDLRAAQDRLSELPEVRRFPADGLIRLERLSERHGSLSERADGLRQERNANEGKLAATIVNQDLLREPPRIESLRRGVDRYESAKKDLPARQTELEGATEDFVESLRGLGPAWDENRVSTFDTSIAARETVRGHRDALSAANQSLDHARLDATRARKSVEGAQRQHERAEKAWKELKEPAERDRDVIEEKHRQARQLLVSLPALHRRVQERQHLEERLVDLERNRSAVERRVLEAMPGPAIWPVAAATFAAVGIGTWLATQGDLVATAGLAIVAVVVVAGHLRQRWQLARAAREHLMKAEEEIEALDAEIGPLSKRIDELAAAVEKDASSLRGTASTLGFEDLPDETQVEMLVTQVEGDLDELRAWAQAQGEANRAEGLVEEEKSRAEEAEDAERLADDEMLKAEQAWNKFARTRGIDRGMSPETCLELLSRIDAAREKLKTVVGLRNRIAGIEAALSDYEKEANSVFAACGERERTPSEFPRAVHELLDSFDRSKEEAQQAKHLGEAIEEQRRNEKLLERQNKAVDSELRQLLRQAGAGDEEEFRNRAAIFSEREELLAFSRERKGNLEKLAGRGAALQAFLRELEAASPEGLHLAEQEVSERIEILQTQLQDEQKEWGRIDEQLKTLESEEESSDLRLRLSVLQEGLEEKARQWAILTIAQALLGETRAKYERERQPAVVQEAQEFFATITSGRYPRLLSPPGENRIEVEDQRGRRKDLTQLSRGTAEQLYLALRFGLVREFGRRSEPLPVIMDEVLVNFDPKRARATCGAIRTLAESHQVILFSCHPETVGLLSSEIKGCSVVELAELSA